MTFKIEIFQFYDKSEPKQWKWNNIRHSCMDIFKSDTTYFLSKDIKIFQWLSKLKVPSFMTELSPNNGNETISDILAWAIFKSDTTYFLSKDIKLFQWLSKLKVPSFMTELSPNNGNETKSDIFSSFFIGRKLLKDFNDFYKWHFSISLEK